MLVCAYSVWPCDVNAPGVWGGHEPLSPYPSAAFTGLQVDVDRVRSDNDLRSGGGDVQRKGGLIIYSGAPPSRELKEQWRREAKQRCGGERGGWGKGREGKGRQS